MHKDVDNMINGVAAFSGSCNDLNGHKEVSCFFHGINPHACPYTQLIDLVLHLVIAMVQYCIFSRTDERLTCLIQILSCH